MGTFRQIWGVDDIAKTFSEPQKVPAERERAGILRLRLGNFLALCALDLSRFSWAPIAIRI